MRALLVMVMMAATPSWACNADLISVQEWEAVNESREDGTVSTHMTASYRYDGNAAYRMIDATILFEDVLGQLIAVYRVDRDEALNAGETSSLSMLSGGGSLHRLGDLDRDDIVVKTCTRAIVYEDGTRETFGD